MNAHVRVSGWLALALVFSGATAHGQIAAPASLDRMVRQRIANFPGHVTLYAKNLDSGADYGLDADAPVRTASTIKLPIMVECFFEVSEGRLKWTEPLTISPEEKTIGSGVAAEFSDNLRLPIRDLVQLMIVLSDNTATNLILNRITGDAVNDRMAALGLKQTRNMRKILRGDNTSPAGVTREGAKPENKQWGIGRSSPREMVWLLERLYRNELVSADASREMIAILKKQEDRLGIGRDLRDAEIASKSGALDALRSDVGIVYTKHGAIAMAITVDGMPDVNWTDDNPAYLLISSLSEILIAGLAR